MKKYELLVILPGTLDEKEAEVRIEELFTMVKEHTENAERSTLGKNRLAYPVKQIRYGYFYVMTFTAEIEKLQALQKKLSLLRDVLRAHITHFNVELNAQQKLAYATGSLGVTMLNTDKEETNDDRPQRTFASAAAPVAPKEEKKVDLEEVKKKLDQILDQTDIIPGV
jgi:small subunit ribosomal protein S6